MKHLLFLMLFISFQGLSQQSILFPKATQDIVVDSFHGIAVEDPYQWMENLQSPQLNNWLEQQALFAEDEMMKSRREAGFLLQSIYRGMGFRSPAKSGSYYLMMASERANEPPVLLASRSPGGNTFRMLDPSKIDRKKNITIGNVVVSGDDEHVAFTYSEDGSDRKSIGVATTVGKILPDKIEHVKFTSIAWRGQGFYYLSAGKQAFQDTVTTSKVYYHKIGTDSADDELVFERKVEAQVDIDIQSTSDERFLIIEERFESRGYVNYFYMDFLQDNPRIRPLIFKTKHPITILDNYDDRLLCATFHKGNNGFLFFLDINDPKNWMQIVPEGEDILIKKAIPLKDQVLVNYYGNGREYLVFFDLNGAMLHTRTIPWGLSIRNITGDKNTDEVTYAQDSYVIPPVLNKIRLKDYKEFLVRGAVVDYDYSQYTLSPVRFMASDSAEVMMLVVHKENIKLDGNNMCLLEAYGGFGTLELPHLRPDVVTFLEKGGMYARALIRGGSDKGRQWHKAGRRLNRQRSYDDFIEAAEELIARGYTSPKRLAISGASNGGLLVAVAAMQRPELFNTVVAKVGVFDMLRFEKFTVGNVHRDEYGTVANEDDFKNLLSYSPYHNIDHSVNYPTMLIYTAENDDRVPPFHSYKYTAAMQANPSQKNPIYLYVEKDAGHYGARTYKGRIAEDARNVGFIIRQLTDD